MIGRDTGWRCREPSHSVCYRPVGGRAHALRAAVLLVVLASTVSAQAGSIAWSTNSPSLTLTYDWELTKTVGGGTGSGSSTATFTVSRGRTVDVPYTITVDRKLASAVGMLSFTVNCPVAIPPATSAYVEEVGGSKLSDSPVNAEKAPFNVAWAKVPDSPTDKSQGQIQATCVYPKGPPVTGPVYDVVFNPGNTVQVRSTGTLNDVITWPTWSTYFPTGGWLTTPPTAAITSGSYPTGAAVTGPFPVQYQYTYTISNTLLCFQGAPILNTATLVTTGSTSTESRTYTKQATATLAIIDCDVKPAFTLDQPNLQTSLTYAWTQSITPLTSSAITVPWGGGGTVQAQATFTRTVTAATFQASFTLTITNPVAAPIALSNLQLACPWGGNTMLPCGSYTGGTNTAWGGTNSWLVIPASGSVNCMVNMLPMTATWGADFTQPCTVLTSNWLGTQVTYTGLVLNFAAPQRWQTINNCAQWSVTCTSPLGNPFYVPMVSGGLPAGQQVCGNEANNAPLPAQQFSVSFSGGWIGDGTQPAACTSAATTTCTSSLQLQSTQGTTQTYGGTQTNTLSLQAMPTDCPKPPSPTPSTNIVLPSPSPPPSGFMTVEPLIVAQVTRTYIRGSFYWTVSTHLAPTNQAILQGSMDGVQGRYTVIAAPQAIAGTEAAQYLLEGVVSVSNPDSTAGVRVDEVFVVVDNSAVPLGCRPALPGILSPGARVDCAFLVNYNQGGLPNAVRGRATVVSDWSVRRTAEGAPARFSFDTADVSNAKGACARVYQTYATNYFDLVQTTGVAPSFTSSEPTTVCSPATWTFDVRFTPREGAPCGVQQAIQTVTAMYGADASGAAQASSTANLFVTGTNCPPAPAEYTTGGSTSGGSGSTSTSGVDSGSTTTNPVGSLSGAQDQVDDLLTNPPPGLSVVLSGVNTQRSDSAGWELAMEAVNSSVSFKPGTAGSVPFKLSWSKTKPLTDYSGTITVINNAAGAAELDGVVVNLMDIRGDAVAEGLAECLDSKTGSLQAVTTSRTRTLAANSRLACNFTLRSTASGSLVGTATTTDGNDAVVSKGVTVTSLMQDGNCAKLISGTAASELGEQGMLSANGTTEEDVCSSGNKIVRILVPADSKTDRGCSFPVVAMAWVQPPNTILSPGAMAYAQAVVTVSGCSTTFEAAGTASVGNLTLTKGRNLRWVVSIATDPPVEEFGEVFDGESIVLTETWQQRPELGLKLNISGEVAVKGTSSATKATVTAIPLCPSPVEAGSCGPVTLQANCKPNPEVKDASRCVFNFTGLTMAPGMLLASVDQAKPAAALPYDIGRAKYALTSIRSGATCAVLTQQRVLEPLDGAPKAEVQATGAAALPTEPFCDTLLSRNTTISFDGIECGEMYAFTARAEAAPAVPGAAAVATEVAFNVTC